MADPAIHDVLNDADQTDQFVLGANNVLRVLLENYDASVSADVQLLSQGGYRWTPSQVNNRTIQVDQTGQQYVLATSRPTRPDGDTAEGVILTVTVSSPSDSAQGGFPVDYVSAEIQRGHSPKG